MKKLIIFFILSALVITGCETLSKLPTNTTGGIFSLNGKWVLNSSSENNALAGTVITVMPGLNTATVTSLSNNNYCLRDNDIIWKDIKSNSGGFFISNLVTACNSTMMYKNAQITVLSNDQVRVYGKGVTGVDLTQTWNRTTQ